MPEIKAYFDGLCEPVNPGGVATWGIVISSGKKVIHRDSGLACDPCSRNATNNYAEYIALIKAARYCLDHEMENVRFMGDSLLVVNQVNGLYRVKSQNIIQLHEQAVALLNRLKSYTLQWIPRKKNAMADNMSREAYEDFLYNGGIQEMIMPFGKYRGVSIAAVGRKYPHYLQWLIADSKFKKSVFARAIKDVLLADSED